MTHVNIRILLTEIIVIVKRFIYLKIPIRRVVEMNYYLKITYKYLHINTQIKKMYFLFISNCIIIMGAKNCV